MKVELTPLPLEERASVVKEALSHGNRLGLITSIDGKQLITLVLEPTSGTVKCYESPIPEGTDTYRSLTPSIPQAHWFERTACDMFGLIPSGHPRLKHTHLHEPYSGMAPPLSAQQRPAPDRHYHFLDVEGEGVYEVPVGPIHAGIIEPGHFRFSCLGEVIVNLEIRLGYVHRGVERRLTEVSVEKGRFIAEAAASDMPVANAIAYSQVIESLSGIAPSQSANTLRTIALEVERVAMHLSDLVGFAGDVGFISVGSNFGQLRGIALRMGDLLAGNRFMRGYVCPGGVSRTTDSARLSELKVSARHLSESMLPVINFLLDNQTAIDRMDGTGKVSHHLAEDFGLVGVAARASGIDYDTRKHFAHGLYPAKAPEVAIERNGDVLDRARIRVSELKSSLALIQELAALPLEGPVSCPVPETLPANQTAVAIVESHRGELIHLAFTDDDGKLKRYAIKDASVNNWTALAICVRNNLLSDFPLCNKSFSLSYSGHDL